MKKRRCTHYQQFITPGTTSEVKSKWVNSHVRALTTYVFMIRSLACSNRHTGYSQPNERQYPWLLDSPA